MAKANADALRLLLEQCPPVGSHFRHYKGGEYVVVGSAILEATLEPVVLYRPVTGDFTWVRTLSDWTSLAQVGEQSLPRFQRFEKI